ncbi:hypothetical protein GALMADRAFT_214390 [Galerina marginata CBS 339.88]|uniref:Uncharacterized protein n=1 Tax=Galerina marginata (strain CBS 339.88) TaxID=685588 RepID=A0A067SKS0_GALM3|nr:hypothetical protein GALMADRAFT_214390 [Galerina marginata CBS 339.88]
MASAGERRDERLNRITSRFGLSFTSLIPLFLTLLWPTFSPSSNTPRLKRTVKRMGNDLNSSTATPTIGSARSVEIEGCSDDPDADRRFAAAAPASQTDKPSTTTKAEGSQNAGRGRGGGGVVFAGQKSVCIYGGTFINCQFRFQEVYIDGGSFYQVDNESG